MTNRAEDKPLDYGKLLSSDPSIWFKTHEDV